MFLIIWQSVCPVILIRIRLIETINKYFGHLKPNPNLPKLPVTHESPIKAPIVKEVLGVDAENVTIGWRFPGSCFS